MARYILETTLEEDEALEHLAEQTQQRVEQIIEHLIEMATQAYWEAR
jgi:hypothetical protein